MGRGGATMPQWDLVQSDCIVIQGSDMAECHPIAFRFALQAKERGATLIHVDPRFSRTSALADLHVPIRPGGDIALLGGLIRHVIQTESFFRAYLLAHTNAAEIVGDGFQDTEDLDGLFSGFDPERREYDQSTWSLGDGARDESLVDPHCVLQIIRRHFARYTPEMVETVTGIAPALFTRLADTLCAASGPDRTAAFCYAVGWTQHTTGVQIIRAAAILQLLLGNMGRPGGGILALRGHATIQGSTDIPTLYNLLPGYLPMPDARERHTTLDEYLAAALPDADGWRNGRAYVVSLLKAWFGENSDASNDFGFGLLPRIAGDYSHLPMFVRMRDGGVQGMFVMGQNPAVGGQNARLQRAAVRKLDWLVVRDVFETETAACWYRGPEFESGDVSPREVATEVFFLPAAVAAEKDGSYTNTHRLIQWHDRAVAPPGDSRSEAWFMVELGRRLKERYAVSDNPRDRAIQALTWEYPVDDDGEPDATAILQEISGHRVSDGQGLRSTAELRDDGSTASGCWIYAGVCPSASENRARARQADPTDGGHHLGWGFAWPDNRRTLYNRASADADGRPWSERKRLLAWDDAAWTWVGGDVPDVSAPPGQGASDSATPWGAPAFGMVPGGRARLFVPSGLVDGPLPAHYEPIESPIANPLYGQSTNPTAMLFAREDNRLHGRADRRFPHILTTYRLTEHHTAGGMSRWLPWLAELQPELFCEIGSQLAAEKSIRHGDWVTISTARGSIEARALVTERVKPFRLGRRWVHQVGLPWHWGFQGLVSGDVVNDLTALVADPNITIHEAKALTCEIAPGRRGSRG